MDERFTCPCCGYQGLEARPYENLFHVPVPHDLEPPYSVHFGMPSYEVCSCCGFEFGNDDEPGTGTPVSFQEYLEEWVAYGSVWFQPERRPASWSLQMQLETVGIGRLLKPGS